MKATLELICVFPDFLPPPGGGLGAAGGVSARELCSIGTECWHLRDSEEAASHPGKATSFMTLILREKFHSWFSSAGPQVNT